VTNLIQGTKASLGGDVHPPGELFAPGQGYDLSAGELVRWKWFQRWRRLEAPSVNAWLAGRRGRGLDLGSGLGPYLARAAGNGSQITAVDVSAGMLAESARRRRRGISWKLGDVRDIPVGSRSMDWVLCNRVLSHVHMPEAALNEILRVCADGASILLSDIHPLHRYSATRLPLEKRKISIETFKHELASHVEIFQRSPRVKGMRWKVIQNPSNAAPLLWLLEVRIR
jgi:SAM-dependent methyltransferase